MSNELDLIVKAIEGLHQGSSIFKDYILPIFTPFLSAILGAGVAFLTMNRQELMQNEKNKIDVCNKWILNIENARLHLAGIKQNYLGQLTDDPIQRYLVVSSIINPTTILMNNTY